ncbi:MAG TPA: response regulator [Bacteriovoracaceae bacterium]|nr:response regulator [Bacteriovoracaceae bacterium]
MSERILYIDDEVDLLELAASFFEDENLKIETCCTFQGALELIRKNQYDLIISDVRMPSGNGHDLMNLIHKEGLFTGKVIMVTGNADEGNDPRHRVYDLIVYKPIDFYELIEQVKKVLLK